MLERIVTAAEAADLIKDGDTVIVGGSAGMGVAESVLVAMEKQFLDAQRPRDLTIIHTTGVGAVTDRGLNRLVHKGLVKRVIGGNYGLQLPFMKELIVTNEIEASSTAPWPPNSPASSPMSRSRPTTCPKAFSASSTAPWPPNSPASSPMSGCTPTWTPARRAAA